MSGQQPRQGVTDLPSTTMVQPLNVSALAADLRVLADDTRLRILQFLASGEQCVCHITDMLGLSQPLASYHLSVLREAGLVRDRHDSRWVYYSTDWDRLQQISAGYGQLLDPQRAYGEAPQHEPRPCPSVDLDGLAARGERGPCDCNGGRAGASRPLMPEGAAHEGMAEELSAQVVVFSKADCPYTRGLRRKLEHEGRPFLELDVLADGANMQRMLALNGGQRKVPTIVTGDQVTVGFHGA